MYLVNVCYQLLPFPLRPELRDLVPIIRGVGVLLPDPVLAEMIPASSIRERIRKRRKLNSRVGINHDDISLQMDLDPTTTDSSENARQDIAVPLQQGLQKQQRQQQQASLEEDIQLFKKQISGLMEAVHSLKEKLEILQPEGKKPSDVEAASKAGLSTSSPKESLNMTTNEGENEVLLSQVVTSQRSILLWEDIQVLVGMACSGNEQLSIKV